MSLSNSMEYRANFFANTTLALLSHTAVQMYLWHAIYTSSGSTQIAGNSMQAMLLYIACANVCLVLTRITRGGWKVATEIRDGQLSRYLLKPVSLPAYMLAQAIAERLVAAVLILVPALAIGLPLLSQYGLGISPVGCLLAVPMLFLGLLINFYMTLTISYFAFWTDEIWTFLVVKDISMWFLSGSMFQLNKLSALSPLAARISELLPFQYLAYTPAQIISGQMPPDQAAPHFALAGLWILILMAANQGMWALGMKRYGAYGG